MRQQIFDDALRQIEKLSLNYSARPNWLLGEINRIAHAALKRDGDPNDKREPAYNPLKDDRNGQ